MNKDQIYGLLRNVGLVLITVLVSTGKLTSEQASTLTVAAEQAGPVLIGMALMAYGAWKKRDVAKALQADALPGVTVTVNPYAAPVAVVKAAALPDNGIKIAA